MFPLLRSCRTDDDHGWGQAQKLSAKHGSRGLQGLDALPAALQRFAQVGLVLAWASSCLPGLPACRQAVCSIPWAAHSLGFPRAGQPSPPRGRQRPPTRLGDAVVLVQAQQRHGALAAGADSCQRCAPVREWGGRQLALAGPVGCCSAQVARGAWCQALLLTSTADAITPGGALLSAPAGCCTSFRTTRCDGRPLAAGAAACMPASPIVIALPLAVWANRVQPVVGPPTAGQPLRPQLARPLFPPPHSAQFMDLASPHKALLPLPAGHSAAATWAVAGVFAALTLASSLNAYVTTRCARHRLSALLLRLHAALSFGAWRMHQTLCRSACTGSGGCLE